MLDDVQFSKNSFTNRCKIKIGDNEVWLTVPVKTKNRFGQTIREVEINNSIRWATKILKTLELNYRKSKFFDRYFPLIVAALYYKPNYLIDLNWIFLNLIAEELGIADKFRFSSSLSIEGEKENLVISIVKAIGSDCYFSGIGAKDYQKAEDFEKAGIQLEYSQFQPKEYPQLGKNFIPNLSVIDLLFNCGPEGIEYLK